VIWSSQQLARRGPICEICLCLCLCLKSVLACTKFVCVLISCGLVNFDQDISIPDEHNVAVHICIGFYSVTSEAEHTTPNILFLFSVKTMTVRG
jgi:hypothetical protein